MKQLPWRSRNLKFNIKEYNNFFKNWDNLIPVKLQVYKGNFQQINIAAEPSTKLKCK